jgi:hypothetical protein
VAREQTKEEAEAELAQLIAVRDQFEALVTAKAEAVAALADEQVGVQVGVKVG